MIVGFTFNILAFEQKHSIHTYKLAPAAGNYNVYIRQFEPIIASHNYIPGA